MKRKRAKRTEALKSKIADAKACGATCKKLKKGSKAKKTCYKKCLRKSLKAAPKSKERTAWGGQGNNPNSALVRGCMRQCKKKGKRSGKDGACVDSCLSDVHSGKGAHVIYADAPGVRSASAAVNSSAARVTPWRLSTTSEWPAWGLMECQLGQLANGSVVANCRTNIRAAYGHQEDNGQYGRGVAISSIAAQCAPLSAG